MRITPAWIMLDITLASPLACTPQPSPAGPVDFATLNLVYDFATLNLACETSFIGNEYAIGPHHRVHMGD